MNLPSKTCMQCNPEGGSEWNQTNAGIAGEPQRGTGMFAKIVGSSITLSARWKGIILLGLISVALTACQRRNEDGSRRGVGSILPGSCSASMPTTYTGPITAGVCAPNLSEPCQHHYQHIAVQSNVIDFPSDRVSVKLIDPTGDITTTPSGHIILARNEVQIFDGLKTGWVSYEITEQLCR